MQGTNLRSRGAGFGWSLLLPALVVLSVGVTTAAAENLLINPGFEDGAGVPDAWQPFTPGPPVMSYVWESGYAQTGTRSGCISSAEPGLGIWQQIVDVVPSTVYLFTGQVAFAGIEPPGTCRLQVGFRDATGQLLELIDLPGHDGTREFALDFPPQLKIRAVETAVTAEVNLYLAGPGQAWFDEVFFGPAPTGSITGVVSCEGQPVPGVRVYIHGEPWNATCEALTDANGVYTLSDMPVTFPRYILLAEKTGYRTQPVGEVAVTEDGTTIVDFSLLPGTDPVDELRVKYGVLERKIATTPMPFPVSAAIPPDVNGYATPLQPYVWSDPYITADDPAVIALANQLVSALPPESQSDTEAVAYAVYEWISMNIDHDGVFDEPPGGLDSPFRDVTSGIWQTISTDGWSWGRSFQDWAYLPAETLEVKSAICVEHARLTCALLRALNIPARARSGSSTFWAQDASGGGGWFTLSTTSGRTSYREHGLLGTGFAEWSDDAFYPVTAEPMLHEDWAADRPGLWRERHPWGVTYAGTPAGLAQAIADLDTFADSGEAAAGQAVPPNENRYQIHYADLTLNLFNVGSQRTLDVRFPLIWDTATHTEISSAYWTNHPDCLLDTYIEEVTNPPVEGGERWLHLVLDLADLLSLGDLNGDGQVDLVDFAACAACLSGPDGGLATDSCGLCDYDGDGDVDLADVASFQIGLDPR